jgi:hypothetical protein
MRVVQRLNHHLGASDLLEATMLLTKVRLPNSVMEDAVGAEIVGIGATNKANDGEILAVGASNGVDHTQASHGERHRAGTNAVGSRVPIGSVTRVELIAATNEVEIGLCDQVVE